MLILDRQLSLHTACQAAMITHSFPMAQISELKAKQPPHLDRQVLRLRQLMAKKKKPRRNLVPGAGHKR